MRVVFFGVSRTCAWPATATLAILAALAALKGT
jgi:hypothetical protein